MVKKFAVFSVGVLMAFAMFVSHVGALSVNIVAENLPEQDVLDLQGDTHELGDLVFPPDELIQSTWVETEQTSCIEFPPDNPNIHNVLVTMTNLTTKTWCHVHYVADLETTITNFDGRIGNLGQQDLCLAFKIDKQGVNTPLVSESLTQDECFEPGEVWQFIIQDFQNSAGSPTPFDSLNIASLSLGAPPSTGSIIALPKEEEFDFGDAPEGDNAIAYPSSGVTGGFPTCMTIGPSAHVQHGPGGAYFFNPAGAPQPPWDGESDGDAGQCPGCFPSYDDDECFLDGDAGLIIPEPFTIDTTGPPGNVIPCPNSSGTPLGLTCTPAVWGGNVDIEVVNNTQSEVYVNVLMDWDQNGQWLGASPCPSGPVPEHVLVDFPVPAGFIGPLSALGPPQFMIGPNSGFVWSRFSVSQNPVGNPEWDGAWIFEDGETEDYLLLVDPSESAPIPTVSEWGMIALFVLLVGSAMWVIRRRTSRVSA